jgi:Leucine-rich repeat (LRR) protein
VLAGLVRLDLRHNQITDGGAQSIVSSPHLGNLKHLDLRGNNLSCDARHELKVRFGPAVIY